MKCDKCGNEHGFRGVQPVDPKTGKLAGPEKVYCKSCGAEVKPPKPESDKADNK